jgi:thioredoxin reductase (NADPH)
MAWDSLGDRAIGEAIFDSIARGWIDHYVVRPSEPSDEVFIRRSRVCCSSGRRRGAPPHTRSTWLASLGLAGPMS